MIESGQVPKESKRVPKKGQIRASTKEGIESGQVPKKGPGDYRKSNRIWASTRRIRASTRKGSNPGEYRKRVESERVPEESGRVPRKERILATTE